MVDFNPLAPGTVCSSRTLLPQFPSQKAVYIIMVLGCSFILVEATTNNWVACRRLYESPKPVGQYASLPSVLRMCSAEETDHPVLAVFPGSCPAFRHLQYGKVGGVC